MTNDKAFFNALFSSETEPSREIMVSRLLIAGRYGSFKMVEFMRGVVKAQQEVNQNLWLMSIAPDNSVEGLQALLGEVEEMYKTSKEELAEFTSNLQENKTSLTEDEAELAETMNDLADGEEPAPYLNFLKHDLKIQRYQIREQEELIEEYQDCIEELEDLAGQIKERLAKGV